MADYYEIVAKRGYERERKIIGTDADISRFEKSGYEVTAKPTTELPKVAAGGVVVKLNTQAADIIAARLIEKMKEEGLVMVATDVETEQEEVQTAKRKSGGDS